MSIYRKLPPEPPPQKLGKPLTSYMVETLRRTTGPGLHAFRVGYAETSRGPFVPRGTIVALWKRGLVAYHSESGLIAHATRKGLETLEATEARRG